jgi:hypothetical protein
MVSGMIDEKFGERFASFSKEVNAQRLVDSDNIFKEIVAANSHSEAQLAQMMNFLQADRTGKLTKAEQSGMASPIFELSNSGVLRQVGERGKS